MDKDEKALETRKVRALEGIHEQLRAMNGHEPQEQESLAGGVTRVPTGAVRLDEHGLRPMGPEDM